MLHNIATKSDVVISFPDTLSTYRAQQAIPLCKSILLFLLLVLNDAHLSLFIIQNFRNSLCLLLGKLTHITRSIRALYQLAHKYVDNSEANGQ